MSTTVYSFGDWLPDLPELGNPGVTHVNNVLPDVQGYTPYRPLQVSNSGTGTLPGTSRGLFSVYDQAGLTRFYAATDTRLFIQSVTTNAFVTVSAALTNSTIFDWSFAQYETLVFACNKDNTMYHTLGAATDFLTSTAPKAGVVGVIGQFVVVGDLREATDRPHVVRWCGIDAPLSWPTPNSATAIAQQAGEQELNQAFGAVQQIINGDQFGIILQENGITRMTYVGPPAVFQFDEIERSRGAAQKLGAVKAGPTVHFYARDGFYATNGVETTPLGLGKVDKTFAENNGGNVIVRPVFDQRKRCVYWCFGSGATTVANKVYAFHADIGKWSQADQALRAVDPSPLSAIGGPYAFNLTNVLSSWDSTAGAIGTGIIVTGEIEMQAGGHAYVDGVKPQVETTGTAPAITVRVGSRNDLGTTPTYTATTTPTTRTGYADFRVDAKYHRAEVQIVGNFDKANGVVVKSFVTGET